MDCIFCKLANKEIPTNIVYENDLAVAFEDTNPQAPVHVLVVPKKHVESLNDLTNDDGTLLTAMMEAIREVVSLKGVKESGYRVVANTGRDGNQTVPHLHWHILGGRDMKWPPG